MLTGQISDQWSTVIWTFFEKMENVKVEMDAKLILSHIYKKVFCLFKSHFRRL
jgi:hypothetical protein